MIGTSIDCFETKENSDGTLTIAKYYKKEGKKASNPTCPKDVVIPNRIDGKTVTATVYNAFYYNKLTSIVIPNTIITIGNSAFRENKTPTVVILDSVKTIGS